MLLLRNNSPSWSLADASKQCALFVPMLAVVHYILQLRLDWRALANTEETPTTMVQLRGEVDRLNSLAVRRQLLRPASNIQHRIPMQLEGPSIQLAASSHTGQLAAIQLAASSSAGQLAASSNAGHAAVRVAMRLDHHDY